MLRWVWGFIIFVVIQFFYNMLWQQGPWPQFHPDRSGGVFGPSGTGAAHIVGYLCVFALMLIAGWWVGRGRQVRPSLRRWALLTAVVVSYNLIFMTDTKHALVLMPIAFLPFLLHPKFPARLRLGLLLCGAVFLLATTAYFQMAMGGYKIAPFLSRFKDSPKGQILYAVTTDFRHLVPYPILGAGPGKFVSRQAVDSRAPLARRYIIPYMDEQRRLGYYSGALAGTTISASILGIAQTDLFLLMGEFGWLGAACYYLFLAWAIMRLWQKSTRLPLSVPASGFYMALACCLIFLIFTTTLISSATVGVLTFPLWMLIGRMWDMDIAATESPEA